MKRLWRSRASRRLVLVATMTVLLLAALVLSIAQAQEPEPSTHVQLSSGEEVQGQEALTGRDDGLLRIIKSSLSEL